ncbi:hypothetical protein LTR28_004470 [Elasticomyces elasticus]|nr:hypothetical protein LTR28_004470 [Elasticomyces elasticus]
MATSPANADGNALRIFSRSCVDCPPQTPTCPTCADGLVCSFISRSCTACPRATCVPNPNPALRSSGPNVGAIAGGVIGGVAVVALLTYLVWRFWIRKRRQDWNKELQDEWEEADDVAAAKAAHPSNGARRSTFREQRDDRMSTHTAASFASSVFTRASNIIQIAYIPGVTNRDGSLLNSANKNAALVPPVPPIPAAHGPPPNSPFSAHSGSSEGRGDALFFKPADLTRDSTYSNGSSTDTRSTMYSTTSGRHEPRISITPSLARSSVATMMFRNDAVADPMPAVPAMIGRPTMVSVKSSTTISPVETPGSVTPTGASNSANENAQDKGKKPINFLIPSQSSGSNPPATSSSLRSNASAARPISLTLTKKGRFPVRSASDVSTVQRSDSDRTANSTRPAVPSPLALEEASESDSDADTEEHATRARQNLINDAPLLSPSQYNDGFADAVRIPASASRPTTVPFAQRIPEANQSAYGSMSRSIGASGAGRSAMGGLSAVIEEATRRASRVPSHEGLGGRNDGSRESLRGVRSGMGDGEESPFDDRNAV